MIASMSFPASDPTPCLSQREAGAASGPAANAEARRISRELARGNESAFQELYDCYHLRLLRLAATLAPSDDAAAHEIVHATLLTAGAKLKGVESEEHLWNWLARVARQHSGKAWRRQKREPEQTTLSDSAIGAVPLATEDSLEKNLDAGLALLDEEDRRVVEWFYFDGMSCKEIAARLATTPKSVSSRLERTRARLRESMTRRMTHED